MMCSPLQLTTECCTVLSFARVQQSISHSWKRHSTISCSHFERTYCQLSSVFEKRDLFSHLRVREDHSSQSLQLMRCVRCQSKRAIALQRRVLNRSSVVLPKTSVRPVFE